MNYKIVNSRILSEIQIFHVNKSKQPWSDKEKLFAISLFYDSSRTYKFLRNKKN